MYPLGMLFGLGFDTATEIALLVIVGMFVALWTLALVIWRFAKIEQQWTAGPELAKAQPGGEPQT
jgi:hypothetical protein